MSPTATIASILVALIFFAWLFQSDTRDPGYDAYLKRQEEAKKADQAQKAAMNINVTDSGVTKDDSDIGQHKKDENQGGYVDDGGGGGVFHGDNSIDLAGNNDPANPSTTKPVVLTGTHNGFSPNAKLHGTFVRVEYVGDTPAAGPDVPAITFRRDGTFATQNMANADVDMEAGTTVIAASDRGSGKYKLHGNTLDLTYTDGLTRKKGPKRTYVVAPVGGSESTPSAITIQGKFFKVDTGRQ